MLLAQSFQHQREAIVNNDIVQKRTISCLYKDGKQTDSFIAENSFYNKLGYVVLIKTFHKTGEVQQAIKYEYKFDSLLLNISTIDKEGKTIAETMKSYDDIGRVISMKRIFYTGERKSVVTLFETDSSAYIKKEFDNSEGKKKLWSEQEFNKNWLLTKQTYYSPEGNIVNISINEYDTVQNIVKSFSVRNDVKSLRSERRYSKDNFITEELHYYSSNVKLSEPTGPMQQFKNGDVRKITFKYNSLGLLDEQFETLNGELVKKVKFEYLK
jgi:hypothetical protein